MVKLLYCCGLRPADFPPASPTLPSCFLMRVYQNFSLFATGIVESPIFWPLYPVKGEIPPDYPLFPLCKCSFLWYTVRCICVWIFTLTKEECFDNGFDHKNFWHLQRP